jgi:hypothetical protein
MHKKGVKEEYLVAFARHKMDRALTTCCRKVRSKVTSDQAILLFASRKKEKEREREKNC